MPAIEYSSRAEWLALRRDRLGASDIPSLFGCGFMSLWSLWMVKAGRVPPPDIDADDRVFWGRVLEDAIAAGVAEREGWRIRRAPYYTHPTVPQFGASPDFEVTDGDRLVALVEVKNVAEDSKRRDWGGEPPARVLLQVQAQLACSGADEVRVVPLIGGCRHEVHVIGRRPRIIAEIEKRVKAFWRSIRENREPPVDGSESTAETLAALYPDASAPPVDLRADNELPEACAGFLRAREARQAAEREERHYANIIKAKVGAAEAAMVAGYTVRATAVAAIPDRAAEPSETIKGRAGYRRLSVSVFEKGEIAA